MDRKRPRRPGAWTALALAAGLLLRLWFVHHAPALAGDALVYGGIAKNLILHGTYGFYHQGAGAASPIAPTLIRLPGYPLFLAACFRLFGMENYRAAIYLQVAFDLWTALLAAGLARRLFGPRAWLPALFAAALCPFTANYTATPLTETLTLWTIALAFYSLRRWQEIQTSGAALNPWLAPLAFALAYSLLLRPEQGLLAAALVPAIALISWRNTRTLTPAAIVSLCVLLPLIPWTIRNYRAFHLFQPLAPRSAADPGEPSPLGANLWFRTWGIDFVSTDEVYWNINGAPILPTDLPNRAFALTCRAPAHIPRTALPLFAETSALLADYNRSPNLTDTPALDARFAALAHRRIAAAPVCTRILLPLARLADMLVRPRLELTRLPDRWWEPPVTRTQRVGILLYAVLDALYLAAAALGLRRALAHTAPATRVILWTTLAAVLLRAALLLTLDNSEPRYTLEFFPIFFVWLAALTPRRKTCHSERSEEPPHFAPASSPGTPPTPTNNSPCT